MGLIQFTPKEIKSSDNESILQNMKMQYFKLERDNKHKDNLWLKSPFYPNKLKSFETWFNKYLRMIERFDNMSNKEYNNLMDIKIAKDAGYCFGVRDAVNMAYDATDKFGIV